MQILARDREQNEEETWIGLIRDLAWCISIKRPKEVVIATKLLTACWFLISSKAYYKTTNRSLEYIWILCMKVSPKQERYLTKTLFSCVFSFKSILLAFGKVGQWVVLIVLELLLLQVLYTCHGIIEVLHTPSLELNKTRIEFFYVNFDT